MIIDGKTRLTFQYYNNQEGIAVYVPLLSERNEHCLLFTFPLIRVFIDDIQVDLSGNLNLEFFELEASNFDLSLGVSNHTGLNHYNNFMYIFLILTKQITNCIY